jgi:DNA-binding transcriptional MerR regulator
VKKQQLSLEELSAAVGMTARNVRAYQTKGLIPPPARRGRRSVYGLEHLRRLQAIERARAKGASLTLIARHLADGRALDDDTVIGWTPSPTASDAGSARADATVPRTEIGALLARLDIQRDAAAQAQVEELIAAGIFQKEGRRVFTGRDLAAALIALQGQGMPMQAALGVAQRAVVAAVPVAESVRITVAAMDAAALAVRGHLTEVACSVVRHVITDHLVS